MIKTVVGVEGMACGMCENHINDTVRRCFSVQSVKSSYKKKQIQVLSQQPLDPVALRKAIEATGYTVTGIEAQPYQKKRLFGF